MRRGVFTLTWTALAIPLPIALGTPTPGMTPLPTGALPGPALRANPLDLVPAATELTGGLAPGRVRLAIVVADIVRPLAGPVEDDAALPTLPVLAVRL